MKENGQKDNFIRNNENTEEKRIGGSANGAVIAYLVAGILLIVGAIVVVRFAKPKETQQLAKDVQQSTKSKVLTESVREVEVKEKALEEQKEVTMQEQKEEPIEVVEESIVAEEESIEAVEESTVVEEELVENDSGNAIEWIDTLNFSELKILACNPSEGNMVISNGEEYIIRENDRLFIFYSDIQEENVVNIIGDIRTYYPKEAYEGEWVWQYRYIEFDRPTEKELQLKLEVSPETEKSIEVTLITPE